MSYLHPRPEEEEGKQMFFFFTEDEKLRGERGLGPWGTNDEKSACNLTSPKMTN